MSTKKANSAERPARSRRASPAAPGIGTPYASAGERRSEGRSLRDAVPRGSHAGWKAPGDRRDPVELLVASNEGRLARLIPIRFARMAASPLAFFRGSAAVMAADLATTPSCGLRVQACGDAHLMNFGAFATPERNIVFDVNDLDETLPAPFEWDLKRLAASLVIAARHVDLPDSDGGRMAVDLVREYRERMTDYASMRALDVWYDRIDLRRFEDRSADPEVAEAARRRIARRIAVEERRTVPDHVYPKLVSEAGARPRIKDELPLVFHPAVELAPGLDSGYEQAFADYRETLPEHTRTLFDRYRFFDLAFKVVGVGSVGTLCALALFLAADDDPLFLQIKEARASVLEPYAGRDRHSNHGERVVAGQRLVQSASDVFLGWTRSLGGRDLYVRQLRDMKMSAVIEDMDAPLLRQYGRMCAHALARAHARSGDAARLAGYMGSGSSFDESVGEFAVEYADQNQSDYRRCVQAIREGRIDASADIG